MSDVYEVRAFDQLKVLSNNLRMKILDLFEDRLPRTNKQMADLLHVPPSKLHYHVRELERVGLLVLVETRENRGVVEKYYLPVAAQIKIAWDKGEDSKEMRSLKRLVRKKVSEEYLEAYWQAHERKFRLEQEGRADEMPEIVDGAMVVYVTDEEREQMMRELLEVHKRWHAKKGKPSEGTASVRVFWTVFPE